MLTTTTALVLFSTLLLAADSYVPAPTNVTLQCRNFRNIVYWNYSQPSLQPKFSIYIRQQRGKLKTLLVEPPNLSCDISFLRDPSNEYSVTVTADGQTEPEGEGLSFSYFKGSIGVDTICKLDLPPVDVTVQKDGNLNFRFFHPSKVYEKGEDFQDLPFEYTVQTKGQNKDVAQEFTCDREVCTEAVLGGSESHCVEIRGEWNGIAIEATQEYCASTGPPVDTTNQKIAYILCPVVVLCIAVIVGGMAFLKLTSGSSKLPAVLQNLIRDRKEETESQETVESQVLFPAERSSPGTTPLLSDVQEDVVFVIAEVCTVTPVHDESVSSVQEDGQGESEKGEESCGDSGKVPDEEEDDNEGENEGPSPYEVRAEVRAEIPDADRAKIAYPYAGGATLDDSGQ